MKQRWAMCVMGAWLAGMVTISVVAAENFYTIDRLLAGSTNATFSALVERLGHPQARDLLRYLSSELNRLYFELWNVTQLVFGLLVLWLIARSPGLALARWGVVGMLGVVLLMMFWLTPEITLVGRRLDFVPRDPAPPDFNRFWVLHGVYTLLSLCSLIVGIVVTISIGRRTLQGHAEPLRGPVA